jgi:hypothetical protein
VVHAFVSTSSRKPALTKTLVHSPLQRQNNPSRNPVPNNNSHHNPHILPHIPGLIAILIQDPLSPNQALVGQIRLPHALAALPARVHPLRKLVDHHPLKDVLLIVPVVEHVFVKHVQDRRRDHEPVDRHPQAVGERHERERDDERGEQAGHEDYQAFSREQVEEEPHHPGEEGLCGRLEVGEPVGDDGEEHADEEEVGNPDEEVGDDQLGCAVQPVVVLLDVLLSVFEEGGDVRDGHERHERGAVELHIESAKVSRLPAGVSPKKLTMALVSGMIELWSVESLSQTVPIMIANPRYMANRIP